MEASLQKTRGVWALVGPNIDNIARTAVRNCPHIQSDQLRCHIPYHITLITKDELRDLSPDRLNQLQRESTKLGTGHIFGAGIGGGKHGVFFVVIIWAVGQQLRKRLALPPKHFHITLSAHDDHEMNKGIQTLLPDQPPLTSPEFLDHSSFTSFIFSQHAEAKEFALKLVRACPDSQKGFLRLADASFATRSFKSAMLAYAQAHDRTDGDKLQSYCIKKMVECSRETEWSTVFQEHEKADIPSDLLVPWSKLLRQKVSDLELTPSLRLEPRDALFVPSGIDKFHKLPRFFRWIIPYRLAVMSTPRQGEDIDILASPHLGIRHVLTLTEETPLPQSWFRRKSISNTFIPVPNYHPPSIEQMDIIMQLIDDERKLPMLVHCGGGKGRAGTVIACYMAAYGFKRPNPHLSQPEMAASEAVAMLRALRPGSIETSQQEAFVSKWCSTIWKRQSIYPERPSEPPPCSMEVEGTIAAESNLFVLVGLPGSGKSWFSSALLARAPHRYWRISQDEAGSRASCESVISRQPGYNYTLLDRCNMSELDREKWLKLASNWAVSPVCVWFDYDREVCTSRAQMRIGHPTLPPGNRVRNAIAQMHQQFVKPQLSEGFAAVVRIRSFQAAQELICFLSPSTIFKFPRTAHLIDVGGATSDDIVSCDLNLSREVVGSVIITEKIDGANMGFSLSSDRSKILVQNRSHFVNHETHDQFKKLGKWVEQHCSDLRQVLDRDPYYAERYILFGEWVYATHSIAYTRLPAFFIAFDLYDRSTSRFVDRPTLEAVLRDTSIPVVPIICELKNKLPSRNDLLELIESTSQFYGGRVEGVYVKVESRGAVQERGKAVRGDFITGNEHWTRGSISLNEILSNHWV
ncbi:ATP dependent DNA ligase [Macrolepiota fuliginosa MF-IS2]|uniref:ATP dependent DNA ligase n=1 Tax=Macrolepiota fuliginosa MF-IS2 TaxID=1400762 RepID=A0A9P5WZ51_9AGAR|nr:ATP dependent DNA ligase [Macrolepiota fuliginosa MF-IS2]